MIDDGDGDLALFLKPETYQHYREYIEVPTANGVTESYRPEEIFLTRCSGDQSDFFNAYGGTNSDYNYRMGETALAMSNLLVECGGHPEQLTSAFQSYLKGYEAGERPFGLAVTPSVENPDDPGQEIDLRNVIENFTLTSCEQLFAFLGFHRQAMAWHAKDRTVDPALFGKNRYTPRYGGKPEERTLFTNLFNQPYDVTWEKYKSKNKRGNMDRIVSCMMDGETIECGSIVDGTLYNGYVTSAQYITLYTRMDGLFCFILGPDLPLAGEFLRRLFEIQYWFIHIMPYYRGSLAVMNIFRYVMLAFYNRKQTDETKRLPLAPNRRDVFPDLHALLFCKSAEDFIEASFKKLYCVDYNAYCVD